MRITIAKTSRVLFSIFTLLTCGFVFATAPDNGVSKSKEDVKFVAGKHYFIVSEAARQKPIVQQLLQEDPHKIQVLLFFSYGCFGCSKLHPYYIDWLKTEPADKIHMMRFPVSFNWAWANLSRAYYMIGEMNMHDKLDAEAFKEMFDDKINLGLVQNLRPFFIKNGLDKEKFNEMFNSFIIEQKVRYADQLTSDFEITVTPSVIINGHKHSYRTDPASAGSYEEFFELIDYLIKKEEAA